MSQQKKNIFIDNSLWNHRWFDDMPLKYQMSYLILWAESDNVGVWELHFRQLNYKLKLEDPGEKVQERGLLEHLNNDKKQVKVLDSGNWWLINYLPTQVNTLFATNRPHVSYIDLLRNHGLLLEYCLANPQKVNFDIINQLNDGEKLDDSKEKKRARKKIQYLESKGLISPLEEAYQALNSPSQGSKEKKQEKDQVTGKSESNDEEQESTTNGLARNSYYNEIRDSMGILTSLHIGDLPFHKDVDKLLKEISTSGVSDPRRYLLEQVKKVDWDHTTWEEMVQRFLAMEEVPF